MQLMLHGAIFVFVMLQLATRESVHRSYEEGLRDGDLSLTLILALHVLVGFLALLCAIASIVLHGRRSDIAGGAPLQAKLADVALGILYAVLLLLPVAGALSWVFPSRTLSQIHEALAWELVAVWPVFLLLTLWRYLRR